MPTEFRSQATRPWFSTREPFAPVLTKADFVRRYRAGEFGNAAQTWNTWDDYAGDYGRGLVTGMIHLRNRVAGGPTWYNVPATEVPNRYADIVNGRIEKPDNIYFSAMAPHDRGTIQGEVEQSTTSLTLTYCSARKPMRQAMAEQFWTTAGVMAWNKLRSAMDPASFDWLQVLLDRYPEHVIEFSCFEIYWGTIPRRNTVFWEVRKY